MDIFPIWSFYVRISINLVNAVFFSFKQWEVDLSILIPIITPHLSTDTNSNGSSTQLHIRCSQFMLPCFIVYNMYFHWQERLQHLLSSCSWGRFCDYTLTQRLQYWLTPQMCNLWIMWALKMCSAAENALTAKLALHSMRNNSTFEKKKFLISQFLCLAFQYNYLYN